MLESFSFAHAVVQRPPGLSEVRLSSSPLLAHPPPPPPRQQQGYAQQDIAQQDITQQPLSSHTRAASHPAPPPGLEGRFVQSQHPSMQSMPQQGSGELHYGGVLTLAPRQHHILEHDAGLETVGNGGWDHNLSRFNPDAGTEAAADDFGSQHAQQQSGFISGSEAGSRGLAPQHAQPTAQTQQSTVTALLGRLQVDNGHYSPHLHSSSTSQPGSVHEASYSRQDAAGDQSQYSQQRANVGGVTLTDRPMLGLPPQQRQRYEPHKQPQSPADPGDDGQSQNSASWDAPSSSQGFHRPFQSRGQSGEYAQSQGHSRDALASPPSADGQHATSSSNGFNSSSSHVVPGIAQNDYQRHQQPDSGQRVASTGMFERASSGNVLIVRRQPPAGHQHERPPGNRAAGYSPHEVSHQTGAMSATGSGLGGDVGGAGPVVSNGYPGESPGMHVHNMHHCLSIATGWWHWCEAMLYGNGIGMKHNARPKHKDVIKTSKMLCMLHVKPGQAVMYSLLVGWRCSNSMCKLCALDQPKLMWVTCSVVCMARLAVAVGVVWQNHDWSIRGLCSMRTCMCDAAGAIEPAEDADQEASTESVGQSNSSRKKEKNKHYWATRGKNRYRNRGRGRGGQQQGGEQ